MAPRSPRSEDANGSVLEAKSHSTRKCLIRLCLEEHLRILLSAPAPIGSPNIGLTAIVTIPFEDVQELIRKVTAMVVYIFHGPSPTVTDTPR